MGLSRTYTNKIEPGYEPSVRGLASRMPDAHVDLVHILIHVHVSYIYVSSYAYLASLTV